MAGVRRRGGAFAQRLRRSGAVIARRPCPNGQYRNHPGGPGTRTDRSMRRHVAANSVVCYQLYATANLKDLFLDQFSRMERIDDTDTGH
ncbi:hypothetical protein MPHO_52270 [Mycolicibacterium phocaicum]|nr:hypothetical protein MPHO_52270 [Mycolicibacterium phocaicum]